MAVAGKDGVVTISDGTRQVTALTSQMAQRALTFCQNNVVNDNATLDAKLQLLSAAAKDQLLFLLVECLIDVRAPNT